VLPCGPEPALIMLGIAIVQGMLAGQSVEYSDAAGLFGLTGSFTNGDVGVSADGGKTFKVRSI
jgi:hypothetical protein